ncbi:MAG: hypothetical protein ACE5FM_00945, partial [Methyloligellaceae bacterium]
MQYLILGLALSLLVYLGLRAFADANPQDVVRNVRKLGGMAALLMAMFLTATGRFALAIPFLLIMVPLLRGGILSSILGG